MGEQASNKLQRRTPFVRNGGPNLSIVKNENGQSLDTLNESMDYTENNSIIGFKGVIGRKHYFVNSLIVCVAMAIFTSIIGWILLKFKLNSQLITVVEFSLNMLLTLIFCTGLFYRRIKDVSYKTPKPIAKTVIMAILSFIPILFFIPIIYTFFWPGILSKRAKNQDP